MLILAVGGFDWTDLIWVGLVVLLPALNGLIQWINNRQAEKDAKERQLREEARKALQQRQGGGQPAARAHHPRPTAQPWPGRRPPTTAQPHRSATTPQPHRPPTVPPQPAEPNVVFEAVEVIEVPQLSRREPAQAPPPRPPVAPPRPPVQPIQRPAPARVEQPARRAPAASPARSSSSDRPVPRGKSSRRAAAQSAGAKSADRARQAQPALQQLDDWDGDKAHHAARAAMRSTALGELDHEAIRRAIVLKELLGPPVGERGWEAPF